MVRPVHGEERALAIERGVVGPVAGQLRAEAIRDVEQVGAVAVAADQVFGLDLGAVRERTRRTCCGRSPRGRRARRPPARSRPSAGSAASGRCGRTCPAGSRSASPGRAPRPRPAELEVPDDRLARDEELVQQDLPRPDRQAPLGDQAPDQRFRAGTHLEVVVDGRSLAVEREAEPRIALHPLEELVDQLDEAHPEDLERLVPLAIPVGVGDEVDDRAARSSRGLGLRPAGRSARARRAMIRCEVTMSARPSTTPAFGAVPSTTSAVEGEKLLLERLRDGPEARVAAGVAGQLGHVQVGRGVEEIRARETRARSTTAR